MTDAGAWILSLAVAMIFAGFAIRTWDDARHHHKWSKWSEPKIVEVLLDGKVTGQAKFQERYCETCGAGQSRRMM